MQLTPTQTKAVKHTKGPLLLIAGAGTGKTTVLVEKIKYLIEKKLAKPEEILALTFTEKAAKEMEDRVDKALPIGFFQTNISTFHAFADKILRDEIIHIGMSPAYKLHTQAQAIMFLRRNIGNLNLHYFKPLSNPNKFLFGLLQHFSRLADEDISPESYSVFAAKQKVDKEKYMELANSYSAFEKLKRAHNVMDFADLISYTLALFRKRKNILKDYQKKFKYILVDEFQDTNIAQYELIKLLAPTKKNSNLTVIGDDNQSIYKFRGASISNILTFTKDYKKTKQIVLTENFRSTQAILDASYKLIKNNDPDTLEARLKISKNLVSKVASNDSTPQFEIHPFVSSEAEQVVKRILEIKKENSVLTYNDFAILTRANNHSEPFIRALLKKGIPFQLPGPGMLLRQPEVKELIAYLEVLYDINNSAAFYRVTQMDVFSIHEIDLARLVSFSRKIGLSLFESALIYLGFSYKDLADEENSHYKPHIFTMRKNSKEKLYKLVTLVNQSINRIKTDSAGQLLFYFLENSGYLTKISHITTEKDEDRAKNISKFFNKLKAYELQEEDASVIAVVDFLNLSMELGDSTPVDEDDFESTNAVTISTIHAAKGLEFDTVFMVNLTAGRFPTYDRKEQIPLPDDLIKEVLPVGNAHLQEERRLFYVGMTRAKSRLFLSGSSFYGEGKREHKISPYVLEAVGESGIQKALVSAQDSKGQLAIFDLPSLRNSFGQLADDDKPVKAKKVKHIPRAFSFSQIQTYLTCPLKYKYQYILKIPTSAGSAASFGTSIHNALQFFYQQHMQNLQPTLNTLLELYKTNWVPIGYGSKKYEQEMKFEGERILREFYNTYHSETLKIAGLEQWFKIKIEDGIYISGKIDRIDYLNDGKIEIIDYKTGKVPSDADLKKEMQLSLYARAATDPSLFGKTLDKITVSYIYFQENKKVSLTKTQKDLDIVMTTIDDVVSKIRVGKFDAHVGPWCSWCPFKINCEAWQ